MTTSKQEKVSSGGPKTMHGVVKAYNFGPKGDNDGVLLEEAGRTFQVNVPPHAWAEFAKTAKVGQSVDIPVEPEPAVVEHPGGVHPAFRFAGAAPKPAAGPHPHHEEPSHGKPATVKGVVTRLNYAKHGEANGVVLKDGDFVHLKPDGMKLVALKVGQEVTAEGEAKPMAHGHQVIEAKVVNGVSLAKAPH